MPRCMICREPIAKSAIGRPQTYCSARCRSAAYRLFERARKELFSEELVETVRQAVAAWRNSTGREVLDDVMAMVANNPILKE